MPQNSVLDIITSNSWRKFTSIYTLAVAKKKLLKARQATQQNLSRAKAENRAKMAILLYYTAIIKLDRSLDALMRFQQSANVPTYATRITITNRYSEAFGVRFPLAI